MILNEKWYSRNTLKLAFECPWNTGIDCGTTANCFSKTAMIYLFVLVFPNRSFCHYVFSFLQFVCFFCNFLAFY